MERDAKDLPKDWRTWQDHDNASKLSLNRVQNVAHRTTVTVQSIHLAETSHGAGRKQLSALLP
jgi:hypothetical protein